MHSARQRSMQADLAIEAYAEKKAATLAERRRREAARAAEKEARRKAMVRTDVPSPLDAHLRALNAGVPGGDAAATEGLLLPAPKWYVRYITLLSRRST
jgi:hypothetical protein